MRAIGHLPSRRFNFFCSPVEATSAMPSTRRRRLPLFLVSMWLPVALWCRTLPLRVTRKRFAVALWLFIFGMCLPFVCCGGDRLGRRLERGRVLCGGLGRVRVLCGGLGCRGLLGRLARGARLLLRQIF